jgi:hypothetical protein
MLSPGEIVIPKSAAKSPEKAKSFIDAIMKHCGYEWVSSSLGIEARIKQLKWEVDNFWVKKE